MPETKNYLVTIPIVGRATVEVEAESEEAAIAKAIEQVTSNDFDEWEAVEHVNQGNVCYAPLFDVQVEEI